MTARTCDCAIDLSWYFQQAPGECGHRSAQGGFENAMNARALCGKAAGCMAIRETYTGAPDADVDDRRLAAWERAREVYARLAQLTAGQRDTLAASYSGGGEVHGVPVSLLVATPTGLAGYRRAMLVSRRLVAKRRASGSPRGAQGLPMGITAVAWVLWLCSRPECGEVVEQMVTEAREMRDETTRAYAEVAA